MAQSWNSELISYFGTIVVAIVVIVGVTVVVAVVDVVVAVAVVVFVVVVVRILDSFSSVQKIGNKLFFL